LAGTKLYELTPEHQAQLESWRDRWIANAMSTTAMTEEDREACRVAVQGLYRAAGRTPLPRERIVFVPSPFVMCFAGGFAAAIWQERKGGVAVWDATAVATRDATEQATWNATEAVTEEATSAAAEDAMRGQRLWREATMDETWDAAMEAARAATGGAARAANKATWNETEDVTWAPTPTLAYGVTRAAMNEAILRAFGAAGDATVAATADAMRDATKNTIDAATEDALQNWYFIPCDMRQLVHEMGGDFGLLCAAEVWRLWQGGKWSPNDAYLSFFEDIAGLRLPEYESYQHWRTLAERSGPRIVHDEFCIVSDRPEVLKVDEHSRPHCDDGPFCRWRDGTALYAVHGVRVPAWLVEQPDRLTVQAIDAERNEEVRRVMIERFGWERYGREDTETLDHDERFGTLRRRGESLWLEVINRSPDPDGSFRRYVLAVHPECRPILSDHGHLGEAQPLTALNAVAASFGMTGDAYRKALPSLEFES